MKTLTFKAHNNYKLACEIAFIELFNRYGKADSDVFNKKTGEFLINSCIGNLYPLNSLDGEKTHLYTFKTEEEIISLYYDSAQTIIQKTFYIASKHLSSLIWEFTFDQNNTLLFIRISLL